MHAGTPDSLSETYSASGRLDHEPVGIDSSLGAAIAAVIPPVALMAWCLVHQLMQ